MGMGGKVATAAAPGCARRTRWIATFGLRPRMKPLIYVHYHGEVEIATWEWVVAVFYVAVIYVLFARQKAARIRSAPEYRYLLWGLAAKLVGGTAFGLVYFYVYAGGDTISYFYSAVAMRNLAFANPGEYLQQLMGDNSMRAWLTYTKDTAFPLQYVFFERRTFAVLQITSVLCILTFNSYLITTLLMASLSYLGIWACYRTFVSYFPQIMGRLAVAFLFMPSPVFWGSAILKDTYTFSATCLWVHCVDEIFFKRRNRVPKVLLLLLSATVILFIKPYIFMVLLPASLIWVSYFRVAAIRSTLVRVTLLPAAVAAMLGLSLYILSQLGSRLNRFALDGALETIQVTQRDLANEQAYGKNRFELGEFDGTWYGLLGKLPIAVNAAIFRPYIWEVATPLMRFSGIENLWVLGLTLLVLIRAGPMFTLRVIAGMPLVLMSVIFALFFAFTVGVTTPNFGALVRFKIPMVPFYISTLYIVSFLASQRRLLRARGMPFRMERFRMGAAWLLPAKPA